MSSLFPGRQPAHLADAAPVAQQASTIDAIGWTASIASGIGAHIAGRAWALSRTSAYALEVIVLAAVMSAFEVRARSLNGDASLRRRHWFPVLVGATAIAASIHVLYDASYEHGTSALGRLLAPAGASPDDVEMAGGWALVAVCILIVATVEAVQAVRRKLRQ
jgi:hypothetical protein